MSLALSKKRGTDTHVTSTRTISGGYRASIARCIEAEKGGFATARHLDRSGEVSWQYQGDFSTSLRFTSLWSK